MVRGRAGRVPRRFLLATLLATVVLGHGAGGSHVTSKKCTLPFNYCGHLRKEGRLSPIQAALLEHVRSDVAHPVYGGRWDDPPPGSSELESVEVSAAGDAESRGTGGAAQLDTAMATATAAAPNVVHFVFGLSDTSAELNYAYFLNVVAAAIVLKPDRIYMHYSTLPHGQWWDEVRPLLHLRRHTDVESVFGVPLRHYAHRADVVRLRMLLELGGVYLDLDSLVLRSFDDLRHRAGRSGALMGHEGVLDSGAAAFAEDRNHYIMVSHFHEHLKRFYPEARTRKGFDAIMNRYGPDHWRIWEEYQRDHGYNFLYEDKCRDEESNEFARRHPRFPWWSNPSYLCNAVMIAAPGSEFMAEWLDRYRYFNDTCWNCHSVWLPTLLADHIMPDKIDVLQAPATFFTPGWHQPDLDALYADGDYDFSNNFALHMWYSTAKRSHGLGRVVRPSYFLRGAARRGGFTTYQKMVRFAIPPALLEEFARLS